MRNENGLLKVVLIAAALCSPVICGAQTLTASAQTAQVDRPIQIDEPTMEAHAITKVAPIYPPEARSQSLSGAVVVYAIIDERGKVKSLEVLSGPEIFRVNALAALNQWTFEPYQVNGQPTKVGTIFTITFAAAK